MTLPRGRSTVRNAHLAREFQVPFFEFSVGIGVQVALARSDSIHALLGDHPYGKPYGVSVLKKTLWKTHAVSAFSRNDGLEATKKCISWYKDHI
jgi:hypothetical protein